MPTFGPLTDPERDVFECASCGHMDDTDYPENFLVTKDLCNRCCFEFIENNKEEVLCWLEYLQKTRSIMEAFYTETPALRS